MPETRITADGPQLPDNDAGQQDTNDIDNAAHLVFINGRATVMSFLRKTFYTIIGLPTTALVAEHFYTIKCVHVDPTDRLPKFSALTTRRMADNLARLDRFERVVPITSLKASTDNLDEASLARKLAKQIWLTKVYAPQKPSASTSSDTINLRARIYRRPSWRRQKFRRGWMFRIALF